MGGTRRRAPVARAPRQRPARRRPPAQVTDSGERLLAPRLALLFLVGCLLFATPALWPAGATASVRIGGVPVLYVALFAAWAMFIGVLGWLVESATRRRGDDLAVEPTDSAAADDVVPDRGGAGDSLHDAGADIEAP